jgi:hypothetical protein
LFIRTQTNAEVELAKRNAVGGGTNATLTEAQEAALRALGYIK